LCIGALPFPASEIMACKPEVIGATRAVNQVEMFTACEQGSTDKACREKRPCHHPTEVCSYFHYITMAWVTPLLRLGSRQPLEESDVWELPCSMRGSSLGASFTTCLKRQRGNHRALKAVIQCSGRFYFRVCAAAIVYICAQVSTPLVLKALISFINDGKQYLMKPLLGIESGWALAAILCSCSICSSLTFHIMLLNASISGCCCRAALMDALYRKAIDLSEGALQNSSLGHIITLVSADLERVFLGSIQTVLLFTSPAVLVITVCLFLREVGLVPTFVGFSVVLVTLPINFLLARMAGNRKRRTLALTDLRVRFMTEILGGMRVVKFYAWEESVESHIQRLRDNETHENAISVQLMILNQSIGFVVPGLVPFFVFLAYVAEGESLTVEKVFAVLALMNILRQPLMMIPRATNGVLQAIVSLQRVERFLCIPERSAGWIPLAPASDIASRSSSLDVDLRAATCVWGGQKERETLEDLARTAAKVKGKGKGQALVTGEKGVAGLAAGLECVGKTKSTGGDRDGRADGDSGGKGKGKPVAGNRDSRAGSNGGLAMGGVDSKCAVAGITLVVPRGQKVAIVGRVGSGKSSLLSCILGELEVVSGTVARSSMVVPYCCQLPWIQSTTVKENILFGLPEDDASYVMAVEKAQLKPDLAILPDGDATSIGENGINLSGGQKARVALARAFYTSLRSQAPLVLLDDPIAAVDAFVAHAIFSEGFLTLLKQHSVVLTLNAHLGMLSSFDRVIVLDGGAIIADGSVTEVMAAVPWIAEAVGKAEKREPHCGALVGQAPVDNSSTVESGRSLRATTMLLTSSQREKPVKAARPLYEPEDRVTGRVQWHNYVAWAQYAISDGSRGRCAGYCVFACMFLLFGSAQALRISLDVWCASWGKEGYDTDLAVGVYGALAFSSFVFTMIRGIFFVFVAMRSCRSMHLVVLRKILLAPINIFFDVTPSGRILNRFSGDIDKVDDKLPEQLMTLLTLVFSATLSVLLCLMSAPFVIVGALIIFYVFFRIVSFYQKSARELKRLDMMTRSPVLQFFGESLKGLSTIRAYDAAPKFIEKYSSFVNQQTKCFFTFWMTSRWLALRVDSVSVALQSLVSLIAVAWKDYSNPVMVGIGLVWGFQLNGMLQFCVRSFAEVENTMTAVERLMAYRHIPQEAAHLLDPRPPTTWPRGEIELRNVSIRYRSELPLVLSGVSFHIHPGERVGVCGRTGSGKSTMGLALFRIVEVEGGQILIDGIDTKTVGLRDLRRRIAMIPQDPILFRMTVRQNLDPFDQHSNEDIWRCLELVCMDLEVKRLPGDVAFLCAEGGTNFSVGQMQLLCIARALLREPGIVMMDEATANVDAASDDVIQRTVRWRFGGATVLIIAHRLTTIVDASKIAVFDQGELREYGTPHELVERGGLLQAFLEEAGIQLPPGVEEAVHARSQAAVTVSL